MSEMCKGPGHGGTLYLTPKVHFLRRAEDQGEDHCTESGQVSTAVCMSWGGR